MQETHLRTLCRALTYRALAVISSVIMLGAVSAVLFEISKTVIYYVLERGWLMISWGIDQDQETHRRTMARALVYRVVVTVAVAYWVGWNLAIWLAVIQTVLYYANERIWLLVRWGRS